MTSDEEQEEKINEFGRLNNRLVEIRADMKQSKEDIEKLDDASSEVMMATDPEFMVFMGEAFVQCDEDFVTEYCEKKTELLNTMLENLSGEESRILQRQKDLKTDLYARFGNSINLET